MTFAEAFDLIEAGQGRWEVRYRGTVVVVGTIMRVADGFDARDWTSVPLGIHRSMDEALRQLVKVADPAFLRVA